MNNSNAHQTLIKKCADTKQIIFPLLKKHGVTVFNYYKWYFNGTVIRLSTHDKMTEFFFAKDFINKLSVPTAYIKKPLSYFIWQIQDCPEVLLDYSINFNLGNGITLAYCHSDHIEYFCFATNIENVSIINNFYINNFDLLENYGNYFKDKASKLIQQCENNKLILSNPEYSKKLALSATQHIQLSDRQLDCAHLLIKGQTYKNIAKIFDISPRTVETHIENLKLKLNCRNKAELIIKLYDLLGK